MALLCPHGISYDSVRIATPLLTHLVLAETDTILWELDAALENLVGEGVFMKQRQWDRNWLSSCVVNTWVQELVQDGLGNGTLNWDSLLMKVLSL